MNTRISSSLPYVFTFLRTATIGFLVLFYLCSISTFFLSTNTFFEGINTQKALQSLQRSPENENTNHTLISLLHKKDPEIRAQLAKLYEKTDGKKAQEEYENSILFDPHNTTYWLEYIRFITRQKNNQQLTTLLYRYGMHLLPPAINTHLNEQDIHASMNNEPVIDILSVSVLKGTEQIKEYAKMLYLLGWNVIETNPVVTKKLWELSVTISPEWSYYHVELAALETSVFQNEKNAQHILDLCTDKPDAKNHCLEEKKIMQTLFPGKYKEHILAIPELYHGNISLPELRK